MTSQLSRNRRVACLAVALAAGATLSLAACSSDSKTAGSTAAPTVAPTAAPAETTPPAPAETIAPADTTSATTSPGTATADTTVAAGPVVIEVDADSGSPIAQIVPLGTELSIHVVTKTDQEFHLHGYDIELAGTDVTFEFTAKKAGDFELESHATETVILNLTVTG